MGPHVLGVKDEPAISKLAESLVREGFDAEVTGTIEDVTRPWRATPPDLMLLNVMLPGRDRRDFCRLIRTESDVPMIMLTARGEEMDRIVGLELGDDDYVGYPGGDPVATDRGAVREDRPA